MRPGNWLTNFQPSTPSTHLPACHGVVVILSWLVASCTPKYDPSPSPAPWWHFRTHTQLGCLYITPLLLPPVMSRAQQGAAARGVVGLRIRIQVPLSTKRTTPVIGNAAAALPPTALFRAVFHQRYGSLAPGSLGKQTTPPGSAVNQVYFLSSGRPRPVLGPGRA